MEDVPVSTGLKDMNVDNPVNIDGKCVDKKDDSDYEDDQSPTRYSLEVPAMMANATTMVEQITNLTKMVEGLNKHKQAQDDLKRANQAKYLLKKVKRTAI